MEGFALTRFSIYITKHFLNTSAFTEGSLWERELSPNGD